MYVVSVRRGGQFTPAVTVGTDLAAYVQNGDQATLTTTVYNDGTTAVENLAVEVRTPDGWSVQPALATRDSLAAGRSWTVQWTIVSDGTGALGPAEFPVDARWTWRETTEEATTSAMTNVVEPIPAGDHYLSDLDWVDATNGWGPVERDRSNGEQGATDGNPITIAGTVYDKGLGAHATSKVTYFAGGDCTQVSAQVGVDDETTNRGSVAFEIWGDGTLLAESGVVTGGQPAIPLTAAVSGVDVLELRVTDGGDGVNYDHADWADARISC
jgi:alpha-galactosidase